jgi:hypothetical protein
MSMLRDCVIPNITPVCPASSLAVLDFLVWLFWSGFSGLASLVWLLWSGFSGLADRDARTEVF